MSKPRYFIRQGLFEAELNEFFSRELVEEGYGGIEVRPSAQNTEIVIKAIRSTHVIGPRGRRMKELKLAIVRRFGLEMSAIKLKVVKIEKERGLHAGLQAEEIRQRLTEGQAVRRVCYRVLRNVMFNGAKGCEIIVTGKLRAQRSKAMKFRKGKILRVGDPVDRYCSMAIVHAKLRQGTLGISVKIVLPWAVDGTPGVPDACPPGEIIVTEPKEDMSVPRVAEIEEDPVDVPMGGGMMPPMGYGGYGH